MINQTPFLTIHILNTFYVSSGAEDIIDNRLQVANAHYVADFWPYRFFYSHHGAARWSIE